MNRNNATLSAVERYAAARLRELRTARRMSQVSLAETMAARGFPWHQPTVSRIESGKQPLGFSEAVALAEIFGVPLDWGLPPEAAAS